VVSINDYRKRAARSEMELKKLLSRAGVEVWHLSPEDSPDLVCETTNGGLIWVEAKAITKPRFDMERDPQTAAQHERLARMVRRGHHVWYAVKFMGRGWRFYEVGHDDQGTRSLSQLGGFDLDTALHLINPNLSTRADKVLGKRVWIQSPQGRKEKGGE